MSVWLYLLVIINVVISFVSIFLGEEFSAIFNMLVAIFVVVNSQVDIS